MFYVDMSDLFSLAKSQHSQGVGSTFFFLFAVHNPGPSARFGAFEESQLAEVWARPLGGMMLFMSFMPLMDRGTAGEMVEVTEDGCGRERGAKRVGCCLASGGGAT
jgi:hypothetical protein